MQYPALLGTLLLIWSGQVLAQGALPGAFRGMAVTSSLLVVNPERDIPTIVPRTLFATLEREELVAVLLQNNSEPRRLSLSRQPQVLRLASSPSPVKYRFTSDSVELRYLFGPAVALRADVGEHHGVRPMWNGFMHSRSPGGPLRDTQATAGIGISF